MKTYQNSIRQLLIRILFIAFQLNLTIGKEYKFCSKEKKVLYSFTSEACPGGIFLKEPLEIDPECYCHDTDIQLYNYCNLAQADPRLRVPHSPDGCQKGFLPALTTRSGYNKIRLMLLSDEATEPDEIEMCELPCAGNNTRQVYRAELKYEFVSDPEPEPGSTETTPKVTIEPENRTEEIHARLNKAYPDDVKVKELNGIPGLKEPYDYNYFSLDPLDTESGSNINWREARKSEHARRRLRQGEDTDPSISSISETPIEPHHGPITTDTDSSHGINPPDSVVPPGSPDSVVPPGSLDPDSANPSGNPDLDSANLSGNPDTDSANPSGSPDTDSANPLGNLDTDLAKPSGSPDPDSENVPSNPAPDSTNPSGNPDPDSANPDPNSQELIPIDHTPGGDGRPVPLIDPPSPGDPSSDLQNQTNPAYSGTPDQPESSAFKLLKDSLKVYMSIVPESVVEHSLLEDIYKIFYGQYQSVDNANKANQKLDDEQMTSLTAILDSCKTQFKDLTFSTDASCPPKITSADDGDSKQQFTEITSPQPSNFRTFSKPGQDFVISSMASIIDSVITKCSQYFSDEPQKEVVFNSMQEIFSAPEISQAWSQRNGPETYKAKFSPLKCSPIGDYKNLDYNIKLIQEAVSKTEKPANATKPKPPPVPCNSNELCDQFPAYPDSGLTDSQKQAIINNNAQNPLTGGTNLATPKIMPVSSTFDAIHKAVLVYQRLLPPEIAGTSLIDEILHRFHLYFESIDSTPGTDRWRDSEKDKVLAALEACHKRTMLLEFSYDDGCPAQVQKVKSKGKFLDIKPPTNKESIWMNNKFMCLNEEDLIIGTMFKVVDTVAAHCDELYKTGVKAGFTGAIIGLFRNNMPIYNKWFGKPAGSGVTSYTGILRHDDLDILSANVDKVDVAVHMLAKIKSSENFYKKPVPNGMSQPNGNAGAGAPSSRRGGGARTGGYSDRNYKPVKIITDFTWDFSNGNSLSSIDPDSKAPSLPNTDVNQFFDPNEVASDENFTGPVTVIQEFEDNEPGAENEWRRRRKRSPFPIFRQGLAAKDKDFKRQTLLKPATTAATTPATTPTTTTPTPVFIPHPQNTGFFNRLANSANALAAQQAEKIKQFDSVAQTATTVPSISKQEQGFGRTVIPEQTEHVRIFETTEKAKTTEPSSTTKLATQLPLIEPSTVPFTFETTRQLDVIAAQDVTRNPFDDITHAQDKESSSYTEKTVYNNRQGASKYQAPQANLLNQKSSEIIKPSDIASTEVQEGNSVRKRQTPQATTVIPLDTTAHPGIKVRMGSPEDLGQLAKLAKIGAKSGKPEKAVTERTLPLRKVKKIPPESAPDEAHLIWGGRAYCLQKKNPTLPATVDNVYPDVNKLCQNHGHKCLPPVQDKTQLQAAIGGCSKFGWENIFLKLHSAGNARVLDVCCYDAKICGPSLSKDECTAKCKAYCISIGADPQANSFYQDNRCLCSSTPAVRRTYLNILTSAG